MRRRTWKTCVLIATLGALGAGCQHAPPRDAHPADPLLANRKPIDGLPEKARPTLAHLEPETPELPSTAVASAPSRVETRTRVASRLRPTPTPQNKTTAVAGGPAIPVVDTKDAKAPTVAPVPALETTPARPPVPATTAVRTSTGPQVEATPVSRQPVAGNYGHAPDHSWVQGVLDRHYDGHSELRYCDPTEEDEWGGKVCLEPNPKLKDLHAGDVVFVEGEIVREGGKAVLGAWHRYPRYRVKDVRFVRSGGASR